MKLTNNDLKEIAKLIEYSFNKVEPMVNMPSFLSRYNHSESYGIYQEQKLTSLVMNTRFKVQVADELVEMAGIGYVSTYPEYRGQGLINKLMSEMLLDCNINGVIVSQLAPFSERFYYKYGYAYTIFQKEYHIPSQSFEHIEDDKSVFIQRGTWDELKTGIIKIYNEYMTSNNEINTVMREDWWWDRLDGYYDERRYAISYHSDGEISGYMIYHITNTTFVIDELCYQDCRSLKGFLSYLKAHTSSCINYLYKAPIHEKLECFLYEKQQIEIRIVPYMMSRIINFPQLIEKIPNIMGDYILEVTSDEYCPWNVGCWKKDETDTYILVQEKGDISASIQTWTELLLGKLTIEDAVFLGRLTLKNSINNKVFIKGKHSFYDYF